MFIDATIAVRKALVVAVLSCFGVLTASAETWTQPGETNIAGFAVKSTLKSDYDLFSCASASAVDGAYQTWDDGIASYLSFSAGSWDTTGGTLTLGAANSTDGAGLGPYTVRVSGSGTKIRTGALNANYGEGSFELLDGASFESVGEISFSLKNTGEKNIVSTQKIVVVDSSFVLDSAKATFGFRKSDSTCRGFAFLYATNSEFAAKQEFSMNYPYYYFKCGKFLFKDCLFDGIRADYAFNVQIGAEVIIDGSAFTSARYRIGDNGYNHADGSPRVSVLSGSLTTDKMLLATSDSVVTSIVHQAGGLMDVAYISICDQASSTSPGRLELCGGTFLASYVMGGNGTRAKLPEKNGWAHLFADGGTLKCKQINKTHPFISGLDAVEIAEGGLTLDDGGLSCNVEQNFSDAPGSRGKLVKTGFGTLTLSVPSEYSVSQTEVLLGTLHMKTNGLSAEVELDTSLIVSNSATFSLEGDVAQVSVGSLKVDHGMFVLDPGDVLAVNGAADVNQAQFRFTALPEPNEFKKIMVVRGALDDKTKQAIINASIENKVEEGYVFLITSETTGETTEFYFVVKEGNGLSGETAWQGTSEDWADEGNWNNGLPDRFTAVSFDYSEMPVNVNVSSAVKVGSISLGGKEVGISGTGNIELSVPRASTLNSLGGTNTINVSMSAIGDFSIFVSPLSSLELASAFNGSGFTKSGSGRIVLSGVNSWAGNLAFESGLNVIANSAALSGATAISLGSGTLEFVDGVSIDFPASTKFTLAAQRASDAVVVDCVQDITVSSFNPMSGVLVKRGEGVLTIDASKGMVSSLSCNMGDSDNAGGCKTKTQQTFDELGNPPAGGYTGLTVSEGELVIKGSGNETLTTVGKFLIGMFSDSCAKQPVLTLDNITIAAPTNIYQVHEVGFKCGESKCVTNPVLRVLNGSQLETVGLRMDNQYSAVARWPVIAVTNSTITASRNDIAISSIHQSVGHSQFLASDSLFRSDKYLVSGRTFSRISASQIKGFLSEFMTFDADSSVAGELVLDEGTVLYCKGLKMDKYDQRYGADFALAFDGATWMIGNEGLVIDENSVDLTRPKRFDVRDRGLVLNIPENCTFSSIMPFTGNGTLTVAGGGVLSFGEGAFAMTGCVNVVEGVADFASAGSVSNFTASGSGTFRGASFSGGIRIAPSFADDCTTTAVATFENCSFAGRVFVDCSRDENDPFAVPSEPVVVARYLGQAPDVASWRVTGTGRRNVAARFSANDGEVTMVVDVKGSVLVVK